jgi:hypothetical protein
VCSAVSRGGQAARRDSSKVSHYTVQVRLLPPHRASGPLEARDPHVPLHYWRADADCSGHVPVDGPSL